MPALPPAPNVMRFRLMFNTTETLRAGSRFFMAYTGNAPSGGDCTTMAGAVSLGFETNLASFMTPQYSLVGVEARDLSSDTSNVGDWSGSVPGTGGGEPPTIDSATMIVHKISRSYRGGKPRIYLPLGTLSSLGPDAQGWTGTYQSALLTAWETFIGTLKGSEYNLTTLGNLVNVSYYQGVNAPVTLPSGRVKQASKMRTGDAVVDQVNSSAVAQFVASQRRRRFSTTA